MSYVIIAIVNEMMYRSLHLAYWQWWRGGRPWMPDEACCLTSQEALTCTQCRDKATRSMFRPPLLNEGAALHKASEVSLSRFHFEESLGWGVGMAEWTMQMLVVTTSEQLRSPGFKISGPSITMKRMVFYWKRMFSLSFKTSECLVLSQTRWHLVLVRWGNCETERSSGLPEFIQLVSDSGG